MMIHDFVTALTSKDFVRLSKCFSEDCRLVDYGPACVGKENSFIYGQNAVNMFYHNKFVLGSHAVQSPLINSERSVNFYTDYGNNSIAHVVATIETYDASSGLIKEMVIRPI